MRIKSCFSTKFSYLSGIFRGDPEGLPIEPTRSLDYGELESARCLLK